MSGPKVNVNLEGKVKRQPETGEMVPEAGASMRIDFEDAQTTWSVDYKKPDVAILRINGRVRVVDARNVKISAKGEMTRNLFDKSTTFEGKLEMEFKKDVQVEISGSSSPEGAQVKAGLQIRF
jgi:hypothetical protein